MTRLAWAALALACLWAAPAVGSWEPRSLGDGHSPAVTSDGTRVVFLTGLDGAPTLVSCETDGREPRIHTGTRVGLPDLPPGSERVSVMLVDSDRAALVGGRTAVLLGAPGMRDLAERLPAAPAIVASARGVALIALTDGSPVVTLIEATSTRTVLTPGAVGSCELSDDGALLLARGESVSWLLDALTGALVREVPSTVSCLSGDGTRLAWFEDGAFHRLDRARDTETAIPAPGVPPRALSLGSEGRRLFAADEKGLSMAAWAGDLLVPIVATEAPADFSLSASGHAVAWESQGEIWVATADTPLTTRPFALPIRGGNPPLDEVLTRLEPLMAALMEQTPAPPTTAVAADGSTLVARAEPPHLSLRVPAGWAVKQPPEGILATAPDDSARLEVSLVAGDDATEWARTRIAPLELPEARGGLLAGREASAWSLALGNGEPPVRLLAARTAEGLLVAVLTWRGDTAPPELEACLESLALR